MKKKYRFYIPIIGFFLILITACQTQVEPIEKENLLEEKKDSLPALEIKQGHMPEDWEKIELGKGYYIAFPEKPKKRTLKSKKRIEYSLSKDSYILYSSQTDLEEEPLLTKANGRIQFYDAVLKDLMEELAGTSEDGLLPQLTFKEEFLFLNIYEAIQAELQATDFQMELKMVAIGKKLLTTAIVLIDELEEEDSEEFKTIKKKFFLSLGKELYIK